MSNKEYFLDTTSDYKVFLKGAKAYVFSQEFGVPEYQFFKRLMARYNNENEQHKLGLARDFDTLYLIEYEYTDMEKRMRRGEYTFSIG